MKSLINRDSLTSRVKQVGESLSSSSLVPEEVFLRMLRLERRRSERSGRAFLLALVSEGELCADSGNVSRTNLVKALAACIRDTDLLGWYQEHAILGLILTEIGDASEARISAIIQKISLTLERSVSIDAYCRLTLVVRVFPHDAEDRVFYPNGHHREKTNRIDRGLKRTIDVLGSLTALIVLSPLFALIAVAVKCTSRGPIFHCRQRLGKYGRRFCFYKFRTMAASNDHHIHEEYVAKLIAGRADQNETAGLYKLKNDPRVTPVGRFLRRTSLDELPQFLNVLMNDMSLVGPRPPLPYEYERYHTWHKRRVLELKPGITGLWQVEGRSRTTFDEMVRMDIRYATSRSVWMDLKIMLQTPAVMFFGRGAC
jgi:lipopolysaccharide/colanic/teichoic acid biosynthesis glycosyltransferase